MCYMIILVILIAYQSKAQIWAGKKTQMVDGGENAENVCKTYARQSEDERVDTGLR